MSRTHVFLSLPCGAFGEVAMGARVALDLVRQGERVVFAAPAEAGVLFRGGPVRHVPVEPMLLDLAGALKRRLATEGAASLTLVDAASTFMVLCSREEDLSLPERLGLPWLALDLWNLPESGLAWDYGIDHLGIPPAALAVPRRLVPVPIARPQAGPVAFSALPEAAWLSRAERRRRRAELGLSNADRLVLVATSRWQLPNQQLWLHLERLARLLPTRLSDVLAGLGPRVHVGHLGPAPWDTWATWGARYRFLGQAGPEELATLFGAADLLLSLNQNAGTHLNAVAAGVPVVVVINSFAGQTVDEVAAALARPLGAAQREWLASLVPLHPFRVWPLGLHRFLAPVMSQNPYARTALTVEMLDEEGLLDRCRRLLFDAAAREAAQAEQASYRSLVSGLPSPAEAFRSCLG